MEKSTKIVLGIIVFGGILPAAIILPWASHSDYEAQNIAGIRDYKAGHYDVAIQELNVYLKVYPLVLREHIHTQGKSDYAEHYLGLALMKQHRYLEAGDAFRIYAHCSDGADGNYMQGEALLDNGNKAEARTAFELAIQNDESRYRNLTWKSQQMIAKIDQSNTKR